ncbi:MAG TPA: EAL domain-containing protein, partial [Haliangium sp.]|nr:EAL domain-containing protein [Haliangium sp.]
MLRRCIRSQGSSHEAHGPDQQAAPVHEKPDLDVFPAHPSTGESTGEGRSMNQYARDMAALEERFERALGTISMVFQPIVYAGDHAMFGYEALLRSSDPDLPHAGALLDAAERLNRLSKLGRIVRRHVAETFAAADESRGLLFVNLHALDLLDRSLSSRFSPLTRIAHRVVLEVTERASLEVVSDIRFRVAELREMGFRIAIDDLGAGYSRMDRFTLLDTDFVKLDMELVRGIDSHPMKRELVASLTKLCRAQNILVIGEGVETEAEAEALITAGCDLLQGYHIAR